MGSMPGVAAPAVDQAFERLARTVLGAAAASITFSGIDTANKIFRLSVYVVKDGTGASIFVRVNNDSAGNYDNQSLQGNGAALTSGRGTGQFALVLSSVSANGHGTFEMYFAKQQTGDEGMTYSSGAYLSTNMFKIDQASIWHNTAALIDRIDLISGGGNFAADTTALLEGNSTT